MGLSWIFTAEHGEKAENYSYFYPPVPRSLRGAPCDLSGERTGVIHLSCTTTSGINTTYGFRL
jgi:hypothetical protein